MPQTYWSSASSAASTAGEADNPTETLIEREIRLQKEREDEVLLQRQLALQHLQRQQQ